MGSARVNIKLGKGCGWVYFFVCGDIKFVVGVGGGRVSIKLGKGCGQNCFF